MSVSLVLRATTARRPSTLAFLVGAAIFARGSDTQNTVNERVAVASGLLHVHKMAASAIVACSTWVPRGMASQNPDKVGVVPVLATHGDPPYPSSCLFQLV